MPLLMCIGVIVLFSILPGVQLQVTPRPRSGVSSCERPSVDLFGSFDPAGSSDGLVAAAYINSDPIVRIINISIVCEASGSTRDTISSLSAIVIYECLTVCERNRNITEHLRWDCLVDDDVASFSSVRGGDIRNPANGTIGTPLMDQCGQCVPPTPLFNSDPATFCLACHEECTGLGKCLGSETGQCCNYYHGNDCVVSCPDGLAPNSLFECVNYTAMDVDGCATLGCETNCTNNEGSFECSCDTGFALAENGLDCNDVDECAILNGGCETNCTNNEGSFECSCDTGFDLAVNGLDCDDVDECAILNGNCETNCTNNEGSFECSCDTGFALAENSLDCNDVDECATLNGGCETNCTNNEGSFECSCDTGFDLAVNGLDCDVLDCGMTDLADPEFGKLTVNSTLLDSVASYTCDSGYTLVGVAMRTCTVNGWSGIDPVCEPNSQLSLANSRIINTIMNDSSLRDILGAEPLDAVNMLQDVFDRRFVETGVVLYLISDILNKFNSTDMEDQKQLLMMILDLSDDVTRKHLNMQEGENKIAVIGSTLLNVLDRLAFEVIAGTTNFSTENIFLQTQLLAPANETKAFITTISSLDRFATEELFPKMSIQIPLELIEMFVDRDDVVRAVSYLYYNVEDLFPSGLPGENDSVLASGIVSTALQCDTMRCPTDNLTLNTSVLITIEHSELTELEESVEILCVFWEFLQSSEDGILSIGQWSERGCSRSKSLSNATVTVCECDHLTHFAILLSAAPLNLTDDVALSLEIISYVGVSISLIAMSVTVFTFILFKSLHNMRNYIHINLCISLGIAQLIFVAGVDQSASDNVPIHCQAIAVLLHYFFLVSFMWMLMEGVVLYVILVEVFVSSTKSKIYVSAFTIASYGIPLLYLAITIPLGFTLPTTTQPNYGYNTVCFLNPETKFIWAFIAPVLVIMLINAGFFVMAAIVIWRHNKKKSNRNKHVKSWLKVLASLIVVMGLTWIIGVLIVEVEELVPLAYIYTIMVAFQGVWIFFIFVVLQEQVRSNYHKLCRTLTRTTEKHYSLTGSSKNKKAAMSGSGGIHMQSTPEANDSTLRAMDRGETVEMIL